MMKIMMMLMSIMLAAAVVVMMVVGLGVGGVPGTGSLVLGNSNSDTRCICPLLARRRRTDCRLPSPLTRGTHGRIASRTEKTFITTWHGDHPNHHTKEASLTGRRRASHRLSAARALCCEPCCVDSTPFQPESLDP